jgi:hypothetical protein
MKLTSFLTAFLAFVFANVAYAEVPSYPAGAQGLECDINEFTPILGDDGENVLYWNNPTCPNGQGGMDANHPSIPKPVVEDPEDEEDDEEVPLDLAKV